MLLDRWARRSDRVTGAPDRHAEHRASSAPARSRNRRNPDERCRGAPRGAGRRGGPRNMGRGLGSPPVRVAYYADELASPAMTRYAAALVYLGSTGTCARRRPTASVSPMPRIAGCHPAPRAIMAGPGAVRAAGRPRAGRTALAVREGLGGFRTAAMYGSANSPFRIFNFEYGMLDDSIHGIRRYCFSMRHARDELRTFVSGRPRRERRAYLDLAVETFAHVLKKPYMEVATVETAAVVRLVEGPHHPLLTSRDPDRPAGRSGPQDRPWPAGTPDHLPEVLASGDVDPQRCVEPSRGSTSRASTTTSPRNGTATT